METSRLYTIPAGQLDAEPPAQARATADRHREYPKWITGPSGPMVVNDAAAERAVNAAIREQARHRPVINGELGRVRSLAVQHAKATDFAARMAPILAELAREGITSHTGIARALNARSIPSRRGGRWQVIQVRRLLERLPVRVTSGTSASARSV